MVGRVGEVLHPLGVVGSLDEAVGCEAVCADVDEAPEGAEDQGDEKVLNDLFPILDSQKLLNFFEFSSQCAEVDLTVDLVPCGVRPFFTFLYLHVLLIL